MGKLAKGTEAKVEQDIPGSARFAQQTVRSEASKDKTAERVCSQCGSPHNLFVCSQCKIVNYCGRKCQKEAWKEHKKVCMPPEPEEGKYDPDDDISEELDYNPDIVWEYKRGSNWITYKRRLCHQIEGLMCLGAPKYIYRPGKPDCEGTYEPVLSRVAPPTVATHHVVFDEMREYEVYTGASRKVRRSGPPPDMRPVYF